MPGNKYLSNNAGTITEVASSQTSAGAPDAGKIPALDGTGHLDSSMMPVGVAPATAVVTASETLAAGDFVNIWNNASAFNVRKADASTTGKEAHGFVLAAVTNGNPATVYLTGEENTQVAGAVAGVVYLSDTTPGGFKSTAPVGSGKIVQRIGAATSATVIAFMPQVPIALA